MKTWSSHWKGSIRPSKQRKYAATAPQHARNSLMSSHLSKELRIKHKCRSMRLRKGDKVKISRGTHKGKTGTVERVDMKTLKAYITNVAITKRDGTKAMYPIHPSKLIITELDMTDKKRFEARTEGAVKK